MADGDKVTTNPEFGQWLLLDANDATGTGNGVWVDTGVYRMDGVLEVNGIAGGTVLTISGSNDDTIPANSAHGTSLGTISADSVQSLAVCRFMKARVSTLGTGTVSARLTASRGF